MLRSWAFWESLGASRLSSQLSREPLAASRELLGTFLGASWSISEKQEYSIAKHGIDTSKCGVLRSCWEFWEAPKRFEIVMGCLWEGNRPHAMAHEHLYWNRIGGPDTTQKLCASVLSAVRLTCAKLTNSLEGVV